MPKKYVKKVPGKSPVAAASRQPEIAQIQAESAKNHYLIPLCFVLAVVPLIVFMKFYEPHMEDYAFFSDIPYSTDLFLYYKGRFFILASAVMLCLIIVQCFTKKVKLSAAKLFIPLGGYVLLAFLSAVFSDTPYYAFWGSFEQLEPVWVHIGYGLVVYYAVVFIKNMKDINLLMNALTISTVIMLLIGVTQAFSADIFRSSFFEEFARLGVPEEYREGSKMAFSFELGRVYLTLYNPNYVGSYVALLSPLFLMLAFAKKKLWFIILNIVIFIGLLLSLLASGSRAGFIGIIVSLLLLVVIFNKRLLKFWMEAIIILTLLVGTFYTMNNYSNNGIINRLKSALSVEEVQYNLTDLTVNKDNAVFTYKGNELTVLFNYNEEQDSVHMDAQFEGQSLPLQTESTNHYVILDDRFSGIGLSLAMVEDKPGCIVTVDGKDWIFAQVDGELYYWNNDGHFTKPVNSETYEPLAKYARFASGRGFIWSKTIPLLADTIILGTGPDTFTVTYPNEDYVDAYNNGYENQTMTKPHNMYLQMAVQTGVLSLVCFLVFYFWYFFSTIRVLIRVDKSKYLALVEIGILCGTFGYMIVGIINDSMVAVAPLFWALTGVGIAINFMLRKEPPVQYKKAKAAEETPDAEPAGLDGKSAEETSDAKPEGFDGKSAEETDKS